MIFTLSLKDFFQLIEKSDDYSKTIEYFGLLNDDLFDESIIKKVLANADLKDAYARIVVSKCISVSEVVPIFNRWLSDMNKITDPRLKSFMYYYFCTGILNNSKFKLWKAKQLCHSSTAFEAGEACWGLTLWPDSSNALVPARMYPDDVWFTGYRNFIINLLCFNSSTCRIAYRAYGYNGGCPKIIKGLRWNGFMRDEHGIERSVMTTDLSLTDDFTAIFATAYDGVGTMEIAEWINPSDVRVFFRIDW